MCEFCPIIMELKLNFMFISEWNSKLSWQARSRRTEITCNFVLNKIYLYPNVATVRYYIIYYIFSCSPSICMYPFIVIWWFENITLHSGLPFKYSLAFKSNKITEMFAVIFPFVDTHMHALVNSILLWSSETAQTFCHQLTNRLGDLVTR